MPAANTDVAGHIHPEGHADTPEARQYSRIRRWISVADATLGIVFLVVLLATGWTRDLRDVAFRFAHEHYVLALFYYVLLLTIISKIVSLPTLGGSGLQPYALNANGQITGFSYTSGNLAAHAFLYSNGTTTDLGTFGGGISQGFAINGAGQVAVFVTVFRDDERPSHRPR